MNMYPLHSLYAVTNRCHVNDLVGHIQVHRRCFPPAVGSSTAATIDVAPRKCRGCTLKVNPTSQPNVTRALMTSYSNCYGP